MKRFCIVSFCNIYLLPYASIYIESIISNGFKCDLLYWDRDCIGGFNDNYTMCDKKIFEHKITPKTPVIFKIIGYLKAINYFKKVLNRQCYNGIVFLQSHGAIACSSLLIKKYRNKFILDIRDYTFEKNKFYYNKEKQLINTSFANIISSPAYKDFLPISSYTIAHNFKPLSCEQIKMIQMKPKLEEYKVINISFIGTIRFMDICKKMLKLFANNEHFCLNFYGTGSEILANYCKENDIENADFYGTFPQEKTIEFYQKTDLINNIYGNHSNYLDFALSNKLYYAALLHIPIIVCPETYMETIVKEYSLGYVFDMNINNAPARLYEWYTSYDRKVFDNGCDRFIERVKIENELFYDKCDEFVQAL